MADGYFTINGVAIKNPSKFKKERYNVTNLARLADATMAGDLIAQKRKFYFTYDAITAAEWQNILDAIWESGTIFFPLEYVENGQQKSATVYVGNIPAELHWADVNHSHWVWKDVTFNLIEQ
jgi:hypothetical protein